MQTFRVIATFFFFAAGAGFIVITLLFFPTNTGAQLMAGPAAATAMIYGIAYTSQSTFFRRMVQRIKRTEAHQVKLIAAQVMIWAVAVGALVYSVIQSI